MQIAITSNTLDVGGAERQRVLLANGLSGKGHRVQLLLLQRAGSLEAQVSREVMVRRLWLKERPAPVDLIVTGTTNTEMFLGARQRYSAGSSRAWAVAVHNPLGPGAPRLAGFAGWAVRGADAVIALTPWHARELLHRWSLDATFIISNGVMSADFREVQQVRATTANFAYDVGYIGRLSAHHKGLDILLRAWSQQRHTLAIAGVGPDEQNLRVMASAMEDRVTFVGECRPQDFFKEVELVVLPSRFEGQPMVALEASAAGVPLVASLAGGMGESLSERRQLNPLTETRLSAAVDDYFREPVVDRRSPATCAPSIDEMVSGYEEMAMTLLEQTSKRTSFWPAR